MRGPVGQVRKCLEKLGEDAKAKFSQWVKDSQKGSQIITHRGEEVAVLQSIAVWTWLMGYLLDTCALSELVAETPGLQARSVLVTLPREKIYFSVVTAGEVLAGIVELRECPRKAYLTGWFNDHVMELYYERTFLMDHSIALRWGTHLAEMRNRRRTMPMADSILAATALLHGLTVVTRNESDSRRCGARVRNPWK